MATDTSITVDPPVPDTPGNAAATLVGDRVVTAQTFESQAGPITVLVSVPRAADRVDIESVAYSASNEVARLAALATTDSEASGDG